MTRAQINLDPETYAKVAALAARLGYVQKGGPRSGQGSPVKLLGAVARGEVAVSDGDLRTACEGLIVAMIQLGKEHHREVAFAQSILGRSSK